MILELFTTYLPLRYLPRWVGTEIEKFIFHDDMNEVGRYMGRYLDDVEVYFNLCSRVLYVVWMLHVGVHTYICVCMTYVISYVMSSYVCRLADILKAYVLKSTKNEFTVLGLY